MSNDLNNPNAMLAKYGKSFNWAAYILTPGQKKHAQGIYAFCRYIDDLVDEQNDPQQAYAQLTEIKQQISKRRSDHIIVSGMLNIMNELGIKPIIVQHLIDGISWDLTNNTLADEKILLRYSYGVASTVGLLMCAVFNVSNPSALRYAIDLGVAMQLTNIARDVIEDAEKGRVYLPQNWFQNGLSAKDILDNGQRRSEIFAGILQLLNLADTYYQSADYGLIYLPGRARASIKVAATLYRAIGVKIRHLKGNEYFHARKVHTHTAEKIILTFCAITQLLSQKKYHKQQEIKEHNIFLHEAIRDLSDHVDTL